MEDNDNLMFGPNEEQLKSYASWEGCDGKFFHPYRKDEKIGKISDYITAAAQVLREKERELDKGIPKKKEEKKP